MTKCEKQCELLKPFNDEYFKGLSYAIIAELAKKSIRLTAENCELEHGLEDMNEQIAELTTKLDFTTRQYEALQKKYAEVLRLAKENADSYKYCMKNLEEEVERLRKMISKNKFILLVFCALVSYFFVFTLPVKEGSFIVWLLNSIAATILIILNLIFKA